MTQRARFFVEGTHRCGDTVAFAGSDAHKIRDVLRMKTGDAVEIFDSAATSFRACVQIAERSVTARLDEIVAVRSAPQVAITVAQGVPKGQKMDYVVEKLTELGVAAIIPLLSEHAVVREVPPAKLERWRRLARTAAQQCGRSDVPNVPVPLDFESLLAAFPSFDAVVLAWELAAGDAPRDRLPALLEGARSILVIVGPEGGISHREAGLAAGAGAHPVSLGGRILRTETAGLVAVSIIGYVLGL